MGCKIRRLESLAPYCEQLEALSIKTTDDLIRQCASAERRQEIFRETGVGESQLNRWIKLARLLQIKGIGEKYSELLAAAGIDTISDLRTRDPGRLAAELDEVNMRVRLSLRAPAVSFVEDWIRQAESIRH